MSNWPTNNWLPALLAECAELPPLALSLLGEGEGLRHGNTGGKWLEPGVDVEESRLYRPGDSVRHINWRLTARSDQVYVKYQPKPTELRLKMLVDLRASSWQGSTIRLKAEQMVRAAFRLAQQLYSSVLIDTQVWAHETLQLPVLRGQSRWHTWAEAWLPIVTGLSSNTLKPALPLSEALADHQDQLCIIISDFIDWDEVLEAQLIEANLRGKVLLVQVLDKQEVQLPKVTSALWGEAAVALTETQRAQYQQQMTQFLQRIQQWCSTLSIGYFPLWADAALSELAQQQDWS
ncbi:MAG: DUF58 domain-containing protein [Gammaproteobacteria bacterium]|nr:DUF58 domain-containing protein [Gammaproteobacteria bacterium]